MDNSCWKEILRLHGVKRGSRGEWGSHLVCCLFGNSKKKKNIPVRFRSSHASIATGMDALSAKAMSAEVGVGCVCVDMKRYFFPLCYHYYSATVDLAVLSFFTINSRVDEMASWVRKRKKNNNIKSTFLTNRVERSYARTKFRPWSPLLRIIRAEKTPLQTISKSKRCHQFFLQLEWKGGVQQHFLPYGVF